MAEETRYTALTGLATVSTSNRFLDGSGTLGLVLVGALSGTFVSSVAIKATGTTNSGMIRFFVYNGASTNLLVEVPVDPIVPSATAESFEVTIPLQISLAANCRLYVSTDKADTFNIVACSSSWDFYSSAVRTDTTQHLPSSSSEVISVANPNRDGSGTLKNVYTASKNGGTINRIIVKSIQNVTSGMIRFYISNGTSNFLFAELPVNTVTKSPIDESYSAQIEFEDFELQSSYSILASTENAEAFIITVDAADYQYQA